MKNFLTFFLYNLLWFLAFLLFAEAGLRVFWKMSPLQGEIYRTSANKVLRYELKPGADTIYEGMPVRINSDGFRDKEYALKKSAGTFRIVVLGDSVAFGRFNQPEDNISRRLQAQLTAQCPSKKFEVLNMGVEGYNTVQEAEMLKTKALKYEPDLVIIYYSLNDADYPEYYFEKNFLNRHFILARYLLYQKKKVMIRKDRKLKGVRTDEEGINYLYNTECWDYTKKTLLEMGDMTAERGIKMVLLIFPEMSEQVKDFGEGFPFWHIIKKLEALGHPNILVVSPVREFARMGLPKDELRNWTYPNLKATDIIAGYAIEKMKEDGVVFCR